MWQIGYITPYKIVLLLLIKKFSRYEFSQLIYYKFTLYLTKTVLNEQSCQQSCSEPSLEKIFEDIGRFSQEPEISKEAINEITKDISRLRALSSLEKFLNGITRIVDWGAQEQPEDRILFQKDSVLGLFVRKCHTEFICLSLDNLNDVYSAFSVYCSGRSEDITPSNTESKKPTSWISEYNVAAFLQEQAVLIETNGKSSIQPTVLHTYLRELDQRVNNIPHIHQTKYLSYSQSKEYARSLYHLHLFFMSSANEGVELQYELLNLGILEHKFGHLPSAIYAFNEALTAARKNKDIGCLQEIQYWLDTCRNSQHFHGSRYLQDTYLNNMMELSRVRNMIYKGGLNQNIFEILYKVSIEIIIKDVKSIDRQHYLITALAWLRTGNGVLASFYLDLAKHTKGGHLEDIEKTLLVNVLMLKLSGNSEAALDLIEKFVSDYPRESEMLLDWKIIRSSLLPRSNGKKRKYFDQQSSVLYTTLLTDSEEYLDGLFQAVQNMIAEEEYESALSTINRIHSLIQQGNKTSSLTGTLILKAETYTKMGHDQDAIPLLQEAMTQSKIISDAKNYYLATMRLAENYIFRGKTKEATLILDCIFPKVLLTNNTNLESIAKRLYSQLS
ncbi:hypothetical protein BY458DRAFT_508773 [Sporodiniella umbellata]|nr:hypothetical protein BY458DRAFT_508773 [Sporodiniella umbellata]